MANTWHSSAQAIAYAANKSMLDVFNATASARVIRVYRAWLFNNGTASVTGVLNQARINIITAASAGTAVTPVTHDTGNSALNANTTSGHNRTVTAANILRQIIHSPDEPTVTTLDWDAIGTLVPFAEWWNSGYADANIQPITCRNGENRGLNISSITQTVGTADLEIEFTDSAT